MKKGVAFKGLQIISAAGERPTDPRPTIDKAREIEAIDQGERTTLQREAIELYETEIGTADERAEMAGRFARRIFGRDGQDAGEFLGFLNQCGLAGEANAIGVAAIDALERIGFFQPQAEAGQKRN